MTLRQVTQANDAKTLDKWWISVSAKRVKQQERPLNQPSFKQAIYISAHIV